jgi:hypothetical protein
MTSYAMWQGMFVLTPNAPFNNRARIYFILAWVDDRRRAHSVHAEPRGEPRGTLILPSCRDNCRSTMWFCKQQQVAGMHHLLGIIVAPHACRGAIDLLETVLITTGRGTQLTACDLGEVGTTRASDGLFVLVKFKARHTSWRRAPTEAAWHEHEHALMVWLLPRTLIVSSESDARVCVVPN